MKMLERVLAVAAKEWRLNLRFSMEYFASNAVSPIKAAILMFLLYRGLLTGTNANLGMVNQDNFQVFVLIGTTCHSLFMSSLFTFRFKMLTEKYWQTFTGTLVSPASIFEVIAGFILGSILIHLLVGVLILLAAVAIFHLTMAQFFAALGVLFVLMIFGFGVGLIGTTVNLVWEGRTWMFDYAVQALVFMSCFYYPIETLPEFLRGAVQILPTFQATHLVQTLILTGAAPNWPWVVSYIVFSSLIVLILPALYMDYAVKKFGLVGY